MGTSTGGTLAIMLAAEQYPEIAGLVLLSPNIAINDKAAFVLNNHWGVQIARLIKGGNFIQADDSSAIYRKYWYTPYRIEGAAQLQQMLEDKMNNETFKQVKQPALLMYYFKDDEHQDKVVKVSAMLDMFAQIATPADKKRAVAIPNAGDHVIGSSIKSGDPATVEHEALMFAELMRWKQ
jgi:alpha-beta hydrolase superfamily lysophospholipase